MNKVEVGRERGGARGAVLLEWAAPVMLALALAACGDAACPKGSKSIDGKCVPASKVTCDGGTERVDGVCMSRSSVAGDDGGVAGGDSQAGRGGSSGGRGGMGGGAGSSASDAGTDNPDPGTDAGGGGEDAAVDAGGMPDEDAGSDPQPDAGHDSGPVPEPCETYSCSGHGTCEVVAGAPRCACGPEYEGDHCEQCATGFGAKGTACVPACEADAAPNCGAHGSCGVVGGAAQCTCMHPYTGSTCGMCTKNFKLDATGTCVPDCGDCGAHGFCDGALMVPECACYTGYTRFGSGCTWVGDGTTGGIGSGTLDMKAPWSSSGVDFIDGAAVFYTNPPEGGSDDCVVGHIAQTLHMPTREQAQPFVVELETTANCTDSNPENCPPFLVQLGQSVTRVRVPGPVGRSERQHFCVGDDGYGDPVQLRVMPGVARVEQVSYLGVGFVSMPSGFDCGSSGPAGSESSAHWPSLRAIAIRVAEVGECDQQDGLVDGDLDRPEKWNLSGGAAMASSTLTLPASGIARAPFLLKARPNLTSPALELSVQNMGGSPGRLEVKIDGLPISAIATEQNTRAHYVCVPDWARGSGHELELRAVSSAKVHSVLVRNEPACGTGGFDRSFDRGLGTGSWFVHALAAPASAARNDTDSSDANSSSVSMGASMLAATMQVPLASDTGGPAISFSGKVAAGGTGSVQFQGTTPALNTTLAVQSTSWTNVSQCLGRIWRGQLIYMTGLGSSSADVLRLDDYGVRNSESCPPQEP